MKERKTKEWGAPYICRSEKNDKKNTKKERAAAAAAAPAAAENTTIQSPHA